MPERKKAVMPRLRFPEFCSASEWEVKKIGDIFRVTRGEVLSMKLVSESYSTETPYPVYSSQTKNNGLSGYYSDYLYEDAITWTTDGANAGDVKYRKGKFYCTNVCGVLISEDGYANSFVAELLNTVTKKHVLYVGNPKLMNGVMAQIQIPFPQIEEQRKIADCLSSLDEVIELQAKKLDSLKTHKKGLMQQLFPREGETTPRLRFPEFSNAGEWKVKRLGDKDVALFVRDTATRKDLCLETYVSTENMLPDFGGVTRASSLPPSGTIRKYQKRDILIANIRPYLKKVWQADKAGTASNDVLVVRPSNTVDPRFLGLVLANDAFISFVMAGAKGVKMPRGDITLIKQFPIPIPVQRKEQQKIADCLSSLDEVIELEAQKLEAFKTHKKGLMQQLFPQEVD